MKNISPLRYPGGKTAMANLLLHTRRINSIGNYSIAEPYGGGAGAALSLLFTENTSEIFINDADSAIYNFWWLSINHPKKLVSLINNSNVSIKEWKRQKLIYNNYKEYSSKMKHGFATFYLNRCNRSGIILKGGPIGGEKQKGKWKIDARFNKKELIRRIEKIEEYRDRIHISRIDGIEFITNLEKTQTFFFIDPPYYNKGRLVYLNSLDNNYHKLLAENLESLKNESWVLTYDDCIEIRKLYSGWANIKQYKLRYSAAERRQGKELLITPKWMSIPKKQSSSAIVW